MGVFSVRDLGTPALKTGNFSKKIGRFSKMQKRIYSNHPLHRKPWKNKEKSVLVNPFLRFTKTTNILLKFSVLRAGVLK